MYKEFIIIITVIVLVFVLDFITNKYTKNTVEIISDELNIMREYILKEDKEKAEEQMQNIKNKWEERYKILAFYLEHDELEKVKTELTGLSAFLSVKEYNECICKIDTSIFILGHIQEKEEFHLRSTF